MRRRGEPVRPPAERAGLAGAGRHRMPNEEDDVKRACEAAALGARAIVTRLARSEDYDIVAVEAIALDTFAESTFSVVAELSRPWARLWVARPDAASAPAGFLVAWHVADELHVLNVAVAPSLRRRGLARALMDEALAYAAGERVRIVLLEVRRSNRPAIKLYRALGFTALGVRAAYYADNDEDAIEMILALDPESGRVLPGQDEIRIDG
jgi:ribosomal-protein-alanine N-acetyltransferase